MCRDHRGLPEVRVDPMNVFPHELAEDALADVLEVHRAIRSAIRLEAHERTRGACNNLFALLDELLMNGTHAKSPTYAQLYTGQWAHLEVPLDAGFAAKWAVGRQ